MKLHEVVSLLGRAELLSGLAQEERVELAGRMRQSTHQAGEIIVRKGDAGDRMMVVASGRVKISTLSSRGTEFLFLMVEEGEVFGELSMIDGRERSADATATRPTEILSLYREDFRHFLLERPVVSMQLLEMLCGKLRRTTNLVEETVFLDFPSRLAARIQELAEEYGESVDGGLMIRHGLSQQEIADSIGAARESVTKQLAVWRERGLLELQRGSILLRSHTQLRAAD